MDAFDTSASALTAQRLRMDVIASNLANVNTTRREDGSIGAYRRRNVVFAPILMQKMGGAPETGFSPPTLGQGSSGVSFHHGIATLKATVQENNDQAGTGVQVVGVVEDTQTPLKQVYDPSHPDADSNGYVSLPNINPVSEMVDMISATRAYEANVTAIQATKSIDKAAMEI